MSEIGLKDIENLARLSRLRFEGAELEAFGEKFKSIMTFVEKVGQANTEGVAPLTTTVAGGQTAGGPQRPDVVTSPTDAVRRDALMGNAPAREMGFFVVPKIVE